MNYSKQVFNLINNHRKSIGAPALVWDEAIFTQCRNHSYNMANGKTAFEHDGFSDRCNKLKPWSGAAENVAYNYSSNSQDVVNQWLNSSGHKKNLENSAYNRSAVAAVKNSKGQWYYTQIFIKR